MSKPDNTPPKIFLRLFRWYCRPRLADHIEGDLLEVHIKRLAKKGKHNANFRFLIDVLLLFRPGIIKPIHTLPQLNYIDMFSSYFKIGWRNLIKNGMFSFITICGLSLGLACSIFIYLWVKDEYEVNAFHQNLDRIYTVTSCEYMGNERNGTYDSPGMLGEELPKIYPEVSFACTMSWQSYNTFEVKDKKIKVPGVFAGKDFFEIFTYPLLAGSKRDVLASKESIAISRGMATTLFGSPQLAIDQIVRFDNYHDFKITGVFEDMNDHGTEKYDFIINWEFFVSRNEWIKDWHNSGPTTYLLLKENADANMLSAKTRHLIKNYDKGYSELDHLELGLQPYREKYLYGNFKNGYIAGGRIQYVKLFTWVGIIVLLIGSINFMNLSTARSLHRAKEIGVRKVNGAMKVSLIGQFLMEAFLITSIAVIVALLLVTALLPQFNVITYKHISSPLTSLPFWIGMVCLTLITTLLSGSYPAFLLSSFKPVAVFRNAIERNSSGTLRQGLVVLQFALSMIFIVSVIVISKQVDFIQTKDIGYQKENLIYVPLSGNLTSNYEVFKQEALKIDGIEHISTMGNRPLGLENSTGGVEWENKPANSNPTFIQAAVGYDFIKTMNSSLVYGREFSPDYSDKTSYVINETALKVLGYKDPIGMPLTFWGVKGTIVGVVEDFHFHSLHVPIRPLILRLMNQSNQFGYVFIRIAPGKTPDALKSLSTLHQKLNPNFIFEEQFADEEFLFYYRSEQIVKQLASYFAFLAIFISCLGLLGLVIFRAEQRNKEIGIRKVLGASVGNIILLLSNDFIRLIVIAIILASPVAFYVMQQWLSGFEYRIGMEWWMFVLAAGTSIVIAMLTISVQSFKAAISNPIKSLKGNG